MSNKRKEDELGVYEVSDRWVEAWGGGGSHIPGPASYQPGWCVCELRNYRDGTVKVFRHAPKYLHEEGVPHEMTYMHAIYIMASRALGVKENDL